MQEIDVQEDVERHWGDVYRYLALVFSQTGLSSMAAEELAIIPGMEDVIALLYLNQYLTEDTYDTITYRLEIALPFVCKEDIDLQRQPEDLVIRVGSFKRHVPLPRTVARLKTAGAKMDGSCLVVRFEEGKSS